MTTVDEQSRMTTAGDHLHLVNRSPLYGKVTLIEPSTFGYVYLAAKIGRGTSPVVMADAARSQVLRELEPLIRALELVDNVVRVTAFRGIVRPPTVRFSSYLRERQERAGLELPNFDVMILIETISPESIGGVEESHAYRMVAEKVRSRAASLRIMKAKNAKRIADVDISRPGLFLFNHFAADDPAQMLELWDYLARWYQAETGLDNSVALIPLEGEPSDYAIVNWARWNTGPLQHFWRQLSRPSFWRFVAKNLEVNHAAAMPIYCRLAYSPTGRRVV